MRVPQRYVESNDMTGRTIYQVERVEVGGSAVIVARGEFRL